MHDTGYARNEEKRGRTHNLVMAKEKQRIEKVGKFLHIDLPRRYFSVRPKGDSLIVKLLNFTIFSYFVYN